MRTHFTIRYLAIFAGRIGFAHLLLSRGNYPNLEDDSGYSPWAWGRRFNRLNMKIIFSDDPDSEVFLGTQLSQEAATATSSSILWVCRCCQTAPRAKGSKFGHTEPERLYRLAI